MILVLLTLLTRCLYILRYVGADPPRQLPHSNAYAKYVAECNLFKDEVAFVGYKVNGDGLTMNEEKTKPIVELPMPENVKQLRRFLGMMSFYQRFIKGQTKCCSIFFSTISKCLLWSSSFFEKTNMSSI
ncbi:hypothetical protein DFA_00887 [Cavenderia fasciculata]|uniref:Uncharacterized protein n=1 Tax=Cavenderia fasciculata TaxID=261658 RepID=F4PUE6_CACFS|nr:uncharacterized protein DFA_00887 [Cavenderia fasciculata]EGG21018.1 hypothetical protein DFA_00887 [Cavenderia fasciculata]|eukprot:XP_004358868.1 hypothetical protein DFA_00887 [Cavenderia fasciculata]